MKNSYLVSKTKQLLIVSISISVFSIFLFQFVSISPWIEMFVLITVQGVTATYILRTLTYHVQLIPHLLALAQEISAGHFEQRITHIDDVTELGQIAIALNDSLDQLESFFREVKATIEHASQEKYFRKMQPTGLHGHFVNLMIAITQTLQITENSILANQKTLSQITNTLSHNIDEMNQRIDETTKNAVNGAEMAKKFGNSAQDGGKHVEEAMVGMNRIANVVQLSADLVQELGKSSEKIGTIVQVIDNIADQTNLLALNASIEAARAGEQGRGFAVVADEVRKLAERTTEATKEIAVMIKQIQKETRDAVDSIQQGNVEVERGKSLADRASNSLQHIIVSAYEVVSVISKVAEASESQLAASRQISKSVETIGNVAHPSSAQARTALLN